MLKGYVHSGENFRRAQPGLRLICTLEEFTRRAELRKVRVGIFFQRKNDTEKREKMKEECGQESNSTSDAPQLIFEGRS